MAITSGFFDSVNGDRLYDAEQMSNYFDGLVSNGVYETIGDRFLVSSANDGMKVSVGSGRAIIQSRWVKNDGAVILPLDPSDAALNRIDAIVLRLDITSRSIELVAKKGTAVSGTPALPEITRNEAIYELYIASVLIRKGATQPSSITDLRPSSYCGWVTGIVQQVDTADLFAQWQIAYERQFAQFDAYIAQKEAAFNEWFAHLTQTLAIDVTVRDYQRYMRTSSKINSGTPIPLRIPQFDYKNDILFIYVNGFYIYGNPRDLSGQWQYLPMLDAVSFNFDLDADMSVTFVVLKSIIGYNVINSGNSIMIANGMISRNIGIAEQEG